MSDIYVPVREARRRQFELYHGQETLFDDPPVLIRASSLPVPPSSPSTTGTGSSLNNHAGSAQDLSGTRALPAKGA